jgi:hypothetical protein
VKKNRKNCLIFGQNQFFTWSHLGAGQCLPNFCSILLLRKLANSFDWNIAWLPVASKTWWRQKSLVLDWWKKKAFCLCAVENVRLNISSMTNYKVAHTFWLVKRFYFTWLETRKCKWNLLSDKLSGIDFSLNFFPLAIKAHSVFFLESFLKSQLGKSNVFFHSFLFCFIRYKLFSWESNLLENVF